MRIDPAEIGELPLPAALLDSRREVVQATPEWRGFHLGVSIYHAGHGYLAVNSDKQEDNTLLSTLDQLLEELELTNSQLNGRDAAASRLLLEGLRLVSGRSLANEPAASAEQVLELAEIGLAIRNQSLEVELIPPPSDLEIPSPSVVALAMIQLALNVAIHERADAEGTQAVSKVFLQAKAGPTLLVEWISQDTSTSQIISQRHIRRRQRWGMGFTRMAADILGGSVLPPAMVGENRKGVSFGLGSRSLTLPLAHFANGELTRSTRAWDQEHSLGNPDLKEFSQSLLITQAQIQPGQLLRSGFYTARAIEKNRVWLALPPEEGSDRVLDVLRGLDHERLLLKAPPLHAIRLHALNLLLRRGLGENLPTCYRDEWASRFSTACNALGLATPLLSPAPFYPDPQLAAFLLSEAGGRLEVEPNGGISYYPAEGWNKPWLQLLEADSEERITLTRGL